MSEHHIPSAHPADWESFPFRPAGGPEIRVWASQAERDPAWDSLLVSTPLGQFQQSSAWARIKRLEGWKATRFIVTDGDHPVGGCQILWKSRFGLRIGYASKGPVVAPASGFGSAEAAALLQRAARRLGLQALVAQAPDHDRQSESSMANAGFIENRLIGVYGATMLVDLTRPFADVERGFSHDVRRQIRRSQRQNVRVRFGDAADADLFFELMKQTCARQGVAPNPSQSASIRAILTEFQPQPGSDANPWARCLFAEREGRTIAGYLLIRFGHRLCEWKKGIAADVGREQPNRLLNWEAMKWAKTLGCRQYELVGLDRRAVEDLLAGLPPAAVAMPSTDTYKLSFGGAPILLPRAGVWLSSTPSRLAYRAFVAFRGMRRQTRIEVKSAAGRPWDGNAKCRIPNSGPRDHGQRTTRPNGRSQ